MPITPPEPPQYSPSLDQYFAGQFASYFLNDPLHSFTLKSELKTFDPQRALKSITDEFNQADRARRIEFIDVFRFIRMRLDQHDCFKYHHENKQLLEYLFNLENIFRPFQASLRTLVSIDFRTRLIIIADETISTSKRQQLLMEQGFSEEDANKISTSPTPGNRAYLLYKAVEKKIDEEKKLHQKQSSPVKETPSPFANERASELNNKVYEQYRGGNYEKNRAGLHQFDQTVLQLLLTGDLIITNEGRSVQPRASGNLSQPELIRQLSQQVRKWYINEGKQLEENQIASALNQAVLEATERIFMHLSIRWDNYGMVKFHSYLDDQAWKNPGVLISHRVGIVLTEKTRKYLCDSDKLKSEFRKQLKSYHPDITRDRLKSSAQEWTARINVAYNILNDPEKFSAWLNGKDLYSV